MTELPNMMDLIERLTRIETKVDALHIPIQDHEHRIRALEGWKSWVIGVATGAGALLGVLINQLLEYVSKNPPG